MLNRFLCAFVNEIFPTSEWKRCNTLLEHERIVQYVTRLATQFDPTSHAYRARKGLMLKRKWARKAKQKPRPVNRLVGRTT